MRKRCKTFVIMVVFAFTVLLAGCGNGTGRGSGSSISVDEERQEEGQEEADEPDFIPWEEAGLQDRVISWHDSELKAYMQDKTGITDRDIRLSDLWEITDIAIYVDDYDVRDISDLFGLINLTMVSLHHCNISDISALSSLTNLTSLSLTDTNVRDISALAGLTNLVILQLQNNEIQNIDALSELRKLQRLNLSNDEKYIGNAIFGLGIVPNGEAPIYRNTHTNQISDISALADLTNLEELYLHGNQISDVSALSGLSSLKMLSLHSNHISDIAFSDLPGLRTLNLANNQISDIRTLSGLKNLRTLYLDYNRISDIDAISGLKKLDRLYLSNNLITDVSALSDLNLSELCLGCNQIVEIDLLPKTMTHLCLENNKISNFDAVLEMTNLNKLYLGGNNVGDDIPTYISGQENSTVNHKESGQVDY